MLNPVSSSPGRSASERIVCYDVAVFRSGAAVRGAAGVLCSVSGAVRSIPRMRRLRRRCRSVPFQLCGGFAAAVAPITFKCAAAPPLSLRSLSCVRRRSRRCRSVQSFSGLMLVRCDRCSARSFGAFGAARSVRVRCSACGAGVSRSVGSVRGIDAAPKALLFVRFVLCAFGAAPAALSCDRCSALLFVRCV